MIGEKEKEKREVYFASLYYILRNISKLFFPRLCCQGGEEGEGALLLAMGPALLWVIH